MVTGIYNLPEEVCSAIGQSVTDFLQVEDFSKNYSYDIKDVFSILSVDSKVIIIESEFMQDVTKAKFISVGSITSAEEFKFINCGFLAPGALRINILILAGKEVPNNLVIVLTRIV